MDNTKIVREQLNKYLEKVNSIVPIDEAYLIGSWARGEQKVDSDVDLLILSNSFSKMGYDERLKILYRFSVGIDFDFHIFPLTRREFSKVSPLTSIGAIKKDKKVLMFESGQAK